MYIFQLERYFQKYKNFKARVSLFLLYVRIKCLFLFICKVFMKFCTLLNIFFCLSSKLGLIFCYCTCSKNHLESFVCYMNILCKKYVIRGGNAKVKLKSFSLNSCITKVFWYFQVLWNATNYIWCRLLLVQFHSFDGCNIIQNIVGAYLFG